MADDHGAAVKAGDEDIRAAGALAVQISETQGERPLTRNWRVKTAEGKDAALVVVKGDAPQAERERFGVAAARMHALGALPGVLAVRSVSPERDAYVADLWTTGSAKDIGVFKWPVRRSLQFVKDVAQALDALHKAGVVHGCLCEENILLSDDLSPVLAEAGSVSVHALVERGGDAASYVAFAAPEINEGTEPEARSDIYSLGRLIQHILRADTVPQVADVVRRCLAPAPAGRYASAGAFIAAIDAAIADLPSAAATPATAASPARAPAPGAKVESPAGVDEARKEPGPPPRWPAPAGGLLVVASIGLAFLGFGATEDRRTALAIALVAGAGLLAWAVQPPKRSPVALRVGFVVAIVVLVLEIDPLDFAYRIVAARTIAHGSPDARRAAIADIVHLGSDFRDMTLAGADLTGVDLRGADLRNVDLSRSDLSHAKLFGALLGGASLDGAKVFGADLRQVDLGGALHVEAAACDAKTSLPDPWQCMAGHPQVAPR